MNILSKALLATLAFSMFAGCSNESGKIVPKAVLPKEEFSEKPKDFAIFNPKVDILFVIDNSGSMEFAQRNLSQNANMFADSISKMAILDYHIGILTTDMDAYSRRDCCGELVGHPNFVSKTTPNMVAALSRNMMVGTNGSATEVMFTPVVAALSAPKENTVNAGFYRQDAFLAVIILTDANEQSRLNPQEFLQFLTTKKGDPEKVLGYGVIRTVAEKDKCRSMEDVDEKLETFLAAVSNGDRSQKNILSLCATDYGVKLAEFAKDIVARSAGTVKLSRVPDVKTIRVTYGTQVIPNSPLNGWVYQPSTNSILLASGIDWDPAQSGAGLSIDFEVIDILD